MDIELVNKISNKNINEINKEDVTTFLYDMFKGNYENLNKEEIIKAKKLISPLIQFYKEEAILAFKIIQTENLEELKKKYKN